MFGPNTRRGGDYFASTVFYVCVDLLFLEYEVRWLFFICQYVVRFSSLLPISSSFLKFVHLEFFEKTRSSER